MKAEILSNRLIQPLMFFDVKLNMRIVEKSLLHFVTAKYFSFICNFTPTHEHHPTEEFYPGQISNNVQYLACIYKPPALPLKFFTFR